MFGTSTNRVELDHTSRELLAVLVEEGGLQVLEGASILNLCVPATIWQDHHGREGLLGADVGRRLRLRWRWFRLKGRRRRSPCQATPGRT